MRNALLVLFSSFFHFLHAQPAVDSIPPLQYAHLGELKLENGSVIHDCKIGYRTLGTLNAAKSNTVLFPSWFGEKAAISQWASAQESSSIAQNTS